MSMVQDSSGFEPEKGKPVPKSTLAYFRARNRQRAFSAIRDQFEKSGISQAELARRLSKAPEVVSRWLSAPTNLQLDTLSDLLFAISGGESEYPVSHPKRAADKDYPEPVWLKGAQTESEVEIGETPPNSREDIKGVWTVQLQCLKDFDQGLMQQPRIFLNDQFVQTNSGAASGKNGPDETDLGQQIVNNLRKVA